MIFLTMYGEEDIFEEAMNLGIKGYVINDSAVTDIIDCIFRNGRQHYLSPSID
ncbi:MAG: hypothetical protein R2942_15940 [Ignavibacteria bacterium]